MANQQKVNYSLYTELAAKGFSNYEIAEQFGVDESTVRRGLRQLGYKRHAIPEDVVERLNLIIDEPIHLSGNTVITADWHIPLYDPEYVNFMIQTSRDENLETLIIGGDFFNFDALSSYDPKQDGAGLEGEIGEGVVVMMALLETFETIVYIWGNHDARLHKTLGYSLRFKEAMKLVFGELGRDALSRIMFSNLDHCWVESAGETYYICHPQSYNRVALTTARKLANKVNTSVITAHAHHCAVGYAEDGEKVIAEAGGLFDKNRTAYLQRTTTHPNWTQGFAYLRDGKLRVHSPKWGLL